MHELVSSLHQVEYQADCFQQSAGSIKNLSEAHSWFSVGIDQTDRMHQQSWIMG